MALDLTVYLLCRFAQRLAKLLGPDGIQVVVRLSAFILLGIGVQILCSGVSELAALLH